MVVWNLFCNVEQYVTYFAINLGSLCCFSFPVQVLRTLKYEKITYHLFADTEEMFNTRNEVRCLLLISYILMFRQIQKETLLGIKCTEIFWIYQQRNCLLRNTLGTIPSGIPIKFLQMFLIFTCARCAFPARSVWSTHRNIFTSSYYLLLLMSKYAEVCTSTQWRTFVVMVIKPYSRGSYEILIISWLFSGQMS